MVLEQLIRHMPKNESESLPYIIYKLNSIWVKDIKIRTEIIKLLEENSYKPLRPWIRQHFFNYVIQNSCFGNRQNSCFGKYTNWTSSKLNSFVDLRNEKMTKE